ncbi:MAG: hypothetical protein AABX37_05270 [Nanoarchaeota archaeon]
MISPMSKRDCTERKSYITIYHIEEVDPSFAREVRRAREGKRLPWVQRPKDKEKGDFLVDVNDAVRLYVELYPLRTDKDALRLQLLVGMGESYSLGHRVGWVDYSLDGTVEKRVRRGEGRKLEVLVKEGNNHAVPALFALTNYVQQWWEKEKFVDDNYHVRVGSVEKRKYVLPLDVVTVLEVADGAGVPNPDYVTKVMSNMTTVRPDALELRFFERQWLGKKRGSYGMRAMSVLYFSLQFPTMASQFTSRTLAERVFCAPKEVVEEAFKETGISPREGKAYNPKDIRTLFGKVFMTGVQKYV